MKLSVVIPVYKKIEMFIENLTYNLPLLSDCEIIVVNDDPSHSIKDILIPFPAVRLIENPTNLGFAGSVHTGITQATGQYVMLLNTDVVLKDTSYRRVLSNFEKDSALFAVSFAQIEKNGETVGKNRIFWKNGFVQHSKASDVTYGSNAWAEGGSCLIDRQKYITLDGFDEIYSPFYWEDIDLSYRAWKAGYTIIFNPEVLVEHHHESTIGAFFSTQYIKTISYRNQLIFIWKNITDPQLINEHRTALIKQTIRSIILDPAFIIGLVKAIIHFSRIRPSKKKVEYTKTDHEILTQFTS